MAEVVAPDAACVDALDWHRFGPELAASLLRRLPSSTPPGQPPYQPSDGVNSQLVRNIRDPRLLASIAHGDA